jgi:catechol 2,3-dioxygenase-like lactoylglutathione lyase family enzyme
MLSHPDHVTVAVTDLPSARRFFELLGFEVTIETVISGEVMERYMGVPGIEADHVTMVLKDAKPHFEIQLLHYHKPRVDSDPSLANLARPGFNHLCFAVNDIEQLAETLRNAGVKFRNELMTFHERKLLFVEGPERITIEFAEWV